MSTSDWLAPGSRLGDLEIERRLGEGAFGQVYLARDTLIGREVALKLVRPSREGAAPGDEQKLLREAKLVGRLRGAHIATLYRVHPLPDAEGWAFEMEYVEGGSLESQLVEGRRFPPERALAIIRGILSGLAEAHAHDVVHGDIKPGNVLLTRDGAVKLVDFGLAHLVSDLSRTARLGELVGTPIYMAPEVVMGEMPTSASDLWSAGVILYRMLAGRLPFSGKTLPAVFYAIENADPPSLDPGLPADLADLAMRCLAKRSAERPASSEEALADLTPAAVHELGRGAPHAREGGAPRLFGRAAERETLLAAARRVAEGRGTTVLLGGALGTGKSALALDLAARTARLGFRWIEARVTALEGFLRPLLTGVRDLLGATEDSSQRLLESELFGTATNLLRALLEEESSVRIQSRQQVLWAVEDLLAGLGTERPLGVIVENAQRADAEDQGLLAEMARRLERARVLLLVVHRSGEGGSDLRELAAREEVRRVDLGPLDPEAVGRVLHERADGARVAPDVLRRILEVAEGNPLFTIELFRHLRETGALVREEDVLQPGPAWSAFTLPRRVRELVLLRLKALQEDERALLDVAAVDGVQFDGETLAAALDRPLLGVLRTLQELYRRTGLVQPRAKGYRFANAVLQEAISAELAPDLRRALHRRLAEELEGRPGVPPERVAVHWEQAGEPARAAPHFVAAAGRGVERQEYLRTLDFVRRAGLGPERLDGVTAAHHADLLLNVAQMCSDLGRHAEAERIHDRILEGANSVSDTDLGLKVEIARAVTRYGTRGLVGLDEEGLRMAAERLSPSFHKGHAWYLLGLVAKYRADLGAAEEAFRKADRVYVACDDLGRHSSALDQLGSVALRRGQYHAAEALYADAARISAFAGRRTNAAISEVNRAHAAFSRGVFAGVEEGFERAIRTFTFEGAEPHAAHARVHLSYLRYAQGDLQRARATVDEAMRPLRRTRYLPGLMSALVAQAHLAAVSGALDLAKQNLAEVRRLAELQENETVLVQAQELACHVACFLGDVPGARRATREALAVALDLAELPSRAELAEWLAEAVVYGLPADLLEDGAPLLETAGFACPGLIEVPRRLWNAARALADPAGASEPLLQAATALRGSDVGRRRAALQALAALLEAEARRRGGDEAGAATIAGQGLAAALQLGHVWLAARLRTFLARGAGGESQAAELEAQLRPIAVRLAPGEREAFLEAWLKAP